MRGLTGGQAAVRIRGATLRELIDNLEAEHPGFKARLLDAASPGRLRPGMAAIVEGEPVGMGLRTKLDEDTEVHFLPAIAGGAEAAIGGGTGSPANPLALF
jgi:molybdopterin synthase sulfur carrier subunit